MLSTSQYNRCSVVNLSFQAPKMQITHSLFREGLNRMLYLRTRGTLEYRGESDSKSYKGRTYTTVQS